MTKTAITPEVGEEILRAFLTETPRPGQRDLAKRFKLTQSAVQRYLKRHGPALNQVNHSTMSSALAVKAIPEATERVMAITKDLTVSKMAQVLSEAERQYNAALKDTNPALAGAYLKEMRQTLESMGKWLGIGDLIKRQDTEVNGAVATEPQIILATKLYPKILTMLNDKQRAELDAYRKQLEEMSQHGGARLV